MCVFEDTLRETARENLYTKLIKNKNIQNSLQVCTHKRLSLLATVYLTIPCAKSRKVLAAVVVVYNN